jgi:hypothetical protein
MAMLYALTIGLYAASGLLVGAAAWSWRKLARGNRIVSSRAFRKTARLTANSLAMLAGSLLWAALVGGVPSGGATPSPGPVPAASPGGARTTPSASVTVHLEDPTPAVEATLMKESDQLTRDCNIGLAGACHSAGQIASALESRGYCQPDASKRWVKGRVCDQIDGNPDLLLGLPRAGSARPPVFRRLLVPGGPPQ